MGRELRRKNNKKNKNNKKIVSEQEELDTSIHGITVLKVCFGIVLILLVSYYVMAVFITKEIDVSDKSSSDLKSSSTSDVSNMILATNIFHQAEETYYVYCYDFSDEDEGVSNAISSFTGGKIYRLDTSNGFNSNYVTDGSGNKEATSLDNLKVSNPTLLVISGDTIRGYYEGRSNIINFLSN